MPKIEIRNHHSRATLWSGKAESIKAAVEQAVKDKANLYKANLSGANLSRVDLGAADLTPIRDDLWAVFSSAPAEIEGLRAAIIQGRIDGSCYEGPCCCLVGTIARVAKRCYLDLPTLTPDSERPAERFFLAIRPDDTPETSQFSRLALEWVDEWLGRMRSAFGPAEAAVNS